MLTPGTRLGPYEVVAPLGAGGMGEVYRARDLRLGREVAVKVLPEGLAADRDRLRRFEQEARATATLSHPNVLSVFDVGSHEGRPYLVEELLEGESLKERLAHGPLPLADAVRMGMEIARGLDAAHAKGIVHRDLKPANVFLTRDGTVKLLDFGLAKLVARPAGSGPADEAATMTEQTTPGALLGTVPYMAPEQARGQPVDVRTDVFALGVVLHEMLAGERPFRGGTATEVAAAILKDEPTPLPAHVPASLAVVVSRCLAKDPALRYQRGGEVRAVLEAVQSGPGPGLAAAAPRHLPWAWVAPLLAVATLGVVLLALGVGRGRTRPAAPASPSPKVVRIAVLPFANLTGDPEQEYLADGLTQEMIAQLGSLHPEGLSVIARSSVMRYKGGATPVDQVGRELNVDYVLEGSVRREANRVRLTSDLVRARDQAQLWSGTHERELAGVLALQAEVAGEVAHRVEVVLTPDQERRLTGTRPVRPEVYEAYVRGMYFVSQSTPESLEKGMRSLHQAVELDPAEPLAYAGLAEGYVTLGHGGGDDPEAFPRARAAAEQALRLDPDKAEAVGVLADVAYYHEWDWPKAERLFERALRLNSSLAMTHYHHAWFLATFDRLDEAIVEHKRARDLDPLRALNTGWLGQLYNYGGRHDEAIVEAKKALELNPRFWPSYLVLRIAYSAKGMHDEAIAAARGLASLDRRRGTAQLVAAYALAGQRERALAAVKEMRADPPPFNFQAQAVVALGDHDEAMRLLEDAYRIHQPTLSAVRIRGGPLAALHGDPRLHDLLRRMNLPPPGEAPGQGAR